MRCQIGDVIALFNGRDGEWLAEIVKLGKRAGIAVTTKVLKKQPEAKNSPWLVFAPIKKNRMDFLVEKATELGAVALLPVITQHCQNTRLKQERIEAQTIEAAEQCERLDVPKVFKEQGLKRLLDHWPEGRILLVCAERSPEAKSFLELRKMGDIKEMGILIGPEGGFSREELELFESYNFIQKISLGSRILRAETAVCTALSLCDALLQK